MPSVLHQPPHPNLHAPSQRTIAMPNGMPSHPPNVNSEYPSIRCIDNMMPSGTLGQRSSLDPPAVPCVSNGRPHGDGQGSSGVHSAHRGDGGADWKSSPPSASNGTGSLTAPSTLLQYPEGDMPRLSRFPSERGPRSMSEPPTTGRTPLLDDLLEDDDYYDDGDEDGHYLLHCWAQRTTTPAPRPKPTFCADDPEAADAPGAANAHTTRSDPDPDPTPEAEANTSCPQITVSDPPLVESSSASNDDPQISEDGFYHCTLDHHWAVRQNTRFRQLSELHSHMHICHNMPRSARQDHLCPYSGCHRSRRGNGFLSERAISVHLASHRLNPTTELLYYLPGEQTPLPGQPQPQPQPPRQPYLGVLRFNAPGRERPEMLHHKWTLGEWTFCATSKIQRYARGNIVAILTWPESGSTDGHPPHRPHVYPLPSRLSFAGTREVLLHDPFTFVYLDDNRLYILPHPSCPGGFDRLLSPMPLPAWWDLVPKFDEPRRQDQGDGVRTALGKAIQDLNTREMSRLVMNFSLDIPFIVTPSYLTAFQLLRRRGADRCGVTRCTDKGTEFGRMTSFQFCEDLSSCRLVFHFYSTVLSSLETFVTSTSRLKDFGIEFHDRNDW